MDVLLSPKVIYKKFSIECPFEDDHHNHTSVHDHALINATDDQCKAKLFTVNPEVRGKTCLHFVGLPFPELSAAGLFLDSSTATRWGVLCQQQCWGWDKCFLVLPAGLAVQCFFADHQCLWLLDGVHHPHSGLRLCLPPWGAAHLHRATRVSKHLTI